MSNWEGSSNYILKLCQDAQGRIMRLQQATNTQVGITTSMRARWYEELRGVAQCFVAAQQASARLEAAANTERGQLRGALKSALDEMEHLKAQRDAAEQEITHLTDQLEGIVGRRRLHEDRPTSRSGQNGNRPRAIALDESTPDILHELPTTVEEMPPSPQLDSSALALQVRGKTSRGYHSSQSKFFGPPQNPTSSGSHSNTSEKSSPDLFGGFSRLSQTPSTWHDPFHAPTASRKMLGNHNSHSPNTTSSILPHPGQARSAGPPGIHAHSNGPHAPRTPAPAHSSEVMVVNKRNLKNFSPGVTPQIGTTDEDRVNGIFGLFNAVRLWVNKYCDAPSEGSVNSLSKNHPQLWDYALMITYPNNRQNAASHASFLLSNRSTRCFFIARMLVQYFAERLWSPEAWEGHDRWLTDTLVGIKRKLDPKYGYDGALQPHERHALVEKRSRVIYDFISQPGWINSEASRVSQTVDHLKGLLGPMLSGGGIDFHAALNELRAISGTALRLSAVLNTCRLSFQYQFNECGIKFSEQSHRALNSSLTGRELQTQQWRVMCVVTPGITYRNDAGVSVDPRLLAKANVMVMQ